MIALYATSGAYKEWVGGGNRDPVRKKHPETPQAPAICQTIASHHTCPVTNQNRNSPKSDHLYWLFSVLDMLYMVTSQA